MGHHVTAAATAERTERCGAFTEMNIDSVLRFIQEHKLYFDAAHALSSVINLVGWCFGAVVLTIAWRRNTIKSISFGPLNVQMQEAAVEAAATAARNWQAKEPGQKVDVPRIRQTISPAFRPEVADNLTGKSVLWVDDNPENNELVVRALRRLRLDVEQTTSTESALAAMQRRHFDLVISDMGRGTDMRAGYGLLKAIRDQGNQIPFLIFSSVDKPEFRREAAERGAQLSTNDMLELIDCVIKYLGSSEGSTRNG
jgi:CheY-like chemotaxis protein